MRAKEMFENLGYNLLKNEIEEITYSNKKSGREHQEICFYTANDIGYCEYATDIKKVIIDIEYLEAIFQQLRELGWIDNTNEMIRFYELEEKATLKKIKQIENHYYFETYDYECTSGYCPNCNESISCDEYHQPKYCSECGQRLDWSGLE